MIGRVGLLTLALFTLACARRSAFETHRITTPATAADYAPYLASGTATITGQAFLRTRGGTVVTAAGSPVTIDPATPYALEWYRTSGTDLKSFGYVPNDSLFVRAHRQVTADAEGRFTVTGLPAGRYIVRSAVVWEIPNPRRLSGRSTEGGVVSAIVNVAAGQRVEVILNELGTRAP